MTGAAWARVRVVLLLLAGVVIQTTFAAGLRVGGVAPDFMLLLAVAAGLATGPEAGAFIGFGAGLLADLSFATTPIGLYALAWCLVGFGVGWLRLNVLSEARLVEPVVGFLASVGGIAVLLVVGALAGQSDLTAGGHAWLVRVAVVEAVWNAVLAVPVTALLRRAARGMRGVDRLGRSDVLVGG